MNLSISEDDLSEDDVSEDDPSEDCILDLPVEIYSAESVRRIDRAAIEAAGIAGYTLMNRAASAALAVGMREFPGARCWQIVCGGGNNGGDGYVLARMAAEQGLSVSAIALRPPDTLTGDAATGAADFLAAGGGVTAWDGTLAPEAELIVDAVLGSGLARNVEGPIAEAVNAINAHAAPVLALDLPSGLHSDTGLVMGTAVHAAHTVTFVGLKEGLFLGRAADFVGRLSFAGLDIPPQCRAPERAVMRRIDEQAVRRALPPRRQSAHKGEFGHLLLVGGGIGMPGAIVLCGEAALRSGAGRVTVATHPLNCAVVVAARPELMCHGIQTAGELKHLLLRASTVALGPGLGTDTWARELFDEVLRHELPAVLDADALNLLAKRSARRDNWVLTPHPGEAARLLSQSTAAVQCDRRQSLAELKVRYGGTIVLKGAGSLVTSAEGPPWLCTAGNPGMASPGMGDVLTGIIAGLLAQGLSLENAAMIGVEVHARAGDAAAAHAPRGLLASDLLPGIRGGVNP